MRKIKVLLLVITMLVASGASAAMMGGGSGMPGGGGMMGGDPGTTPTDPGTMPGGGGMMGGDPGTTPTDPGTMPGGGGMMGGDPGTMPTDPGTMPGGGMMGDGYAPGYGSTMMDGGPGTTPGMMGSMQMPTHQEMYTYHPVDTPTIGADLASTMPIGIGPAAMGGNMLKVSAAVGQFEAPVDMYMAIYAPGIDPFNVYMMQQDGSVQPLSTGMARWKTGVTGVDEVVLDGISTSTLPAGAYMLGLMVTPSGGDLSSYYLWMTNFVVQ